MILRNLSNISIPKINLNKSLPLSGKMEIIKSIGVNKWLVSFLGNYFEVKSSLPLRVGVRYLAKMVNNSGKFSIQVNYTALFEDLDLLESSNKFIVKQNGNFDQSISGILKGVFDSVEDEFILKFLLTLQGQDIKAQDFIKIYDYFSNKIEQKEQSNKLPIFIENDNNFIISIPFRFMEGSGLLFLFSCKDLKMLYRWSFVYFFSKQEKIICEFDKASSDSKVRIYSDFSLDDVLGELSSVLCSYRITDIKVLDSIKEFEDFDCELIVVKSINFKV
ncbi:hypothetical protein [Candidatus Borreliella tachyglossi]|uniref:hypothetical protein n=1 Tax=Candidatus Borreliella tachyglossi TaxID=1964448 RepID=UPI004043248B